MYSCPSGHLFCVEDVDPANVGAVDYEQFLEISKSTSEHVWLNSYSITGIRYF